MELLAFDNLAGARHADYTPGSADLPAFVQVLGRLQQIPCHSLQVKQAEQRWAATLMMARPGTCSQARHFCIPTSTRSDSWATASHKAIDAFALACARLYAEIAREDPQPWKRRLAAASVDWAQHRNVSTGRRGQPLAG